VGRKGRAQGPALFFYSQLLKAELAKLTNETAIPSAAT
jgi:hypothetical protein